jgi:hypothetical protein
MFLEVEAFALKRADVLYSSPGSRFPIAPSVYMLLSLQCKLTYTCANKLKDCIIVKEEDSNNVFTRLRTYIISLII